MQNTIRCNAHAIAEANRPAGLSEDLCLRRNKNVLPDDHGFELSKRLLDLRLPR